MSEKFIKLQNINGEIQFRGDKSALFGDRGDTFAAWNFEQETLLVENDWSGCRPLFYYQSASQIIVSKSIVKLLEVGAPAEWDFPALSVFLRLGFFVGEDTAFKGIQQLPPGTKMIWRDGKITLTSDGYLDAQPSQLDRGETVECYAHFFRQAIERRLPVSNDFGLPLSAGCDSRWILYELLRKNVTPRECITLTHFPPRSNADSRIAAKICQEFDLKHTILHQPDSFVEPELEKNLLTNFCADEHNWFLPLANYINNRFETTYDGLAGDVLCGETGFSDENLQKLHVCFEQAD